MTIIAKVLCYFTVIFSLVGLGVAIWIGIDRRDWKGEKAALDSEIVRRRGMRKVEERALKTLLIELGQGGRSMPSSATALPATADGAPAVAASVAKYRSENKQLQKENEADLNDANKLEVQHNAILDDVAKARKETEAGGAEQKNLREQIKPDTDKEPDRKPIRDVIGDHRGARVGAEQQQESIKPDLFNEQLRVFQLLKRNAELLKRVEQLKALKATSASAKP